MNLSGTAISPDAGAGLISVLDEARTLGFLGPGAIEPQVEHAMGFAVAAGEPPSSFADLGSGGGLPALVLALAWPDSSAVLVESQKRRAEFLDHAAQRLGVGDRVEIREVRAEEAGHDPRLRHHFELVTARGFGPPAVTAECGAPLLATGGALIVSEPPGESDRWPDQGLALLGLVRAAEVVTVAHYAVLRAAGPCDERFPRRSGVPRKRPLF